jgi:hypothetical protein
MVLLLTDGLVGALAFGTSGGLISSIEKLHVSTGIFQGRSVDNVIKYLLLLCMGRTPPHPHPARGPCWRPGSRLSVTPKPWAGVVPEAT